MIELGSKVKDGVTGLQGVAVSRVEYLNGCRQYGVQPKVDKQGKVPKAHYVDEGQLTVVKAKAKPKATRKAKDRPGGPSSCEPPSGSSGTL